ncbi:MAG: NusA-like transcription termination signal-binding factor [Nanoarchaeota archaeon]|nr:NusA-like transcription termination signal-binding factor [Nanoarchaeota archaeon]
MRIRIKLDNDTIRHITLFEKITGATVKDCFSNDNAITFVVKEGHAGIAIGRGGINIKTLQKTLKKRIEVIEYSEEPTKFVNNVFRPAKMKNVYTSEKSDGQKIINIYPTSDKALIRSKLKKAKELVKKYFGIEDIIIK